MTRTLPRFCSFALFVALTRCAGSAFFAPHTHLPDSNLPTRTFGCCAVLRIYRLVYRWFGSVTATACVAAHHTTTLHTTPHLTPVPTPFAVAGCAPVCRLLPGFARTVAFGCRACPYHLRCRVPLPYSPGSRLRSSTVVLCTYQFSSPPPVLFCGLHRCYWFAVPRFGCLVLAAWITFTTTLHTCGCLVLPRFLFTTPFGCWFAAGLRLTVVVYPPGCCYYTLPCRSRLLHHHHLPYGLPHPHTIYPASPACPCTCHHHLQRCAVRHAHATHRTYIPAPLQHTYTVPGAPPTCHCHTYTHLPTVFAVCGFFGHRRTFLPTPPTPTLPPTHCHVAVCRSRAVRWLHVLLPLRVVGVQLRSPDPALRRRLPIYRTFAHTAAFDAAPTTLTHWSSRCVHLHWFVPFTTCLYHVIPNYLVTRVVILPILRCRFACVGFCLYPTATPRWFARLRTLRLVAVTRICYCGCAFVLL